MLDFYQLFEKVTTKIKRSSMPSEPPEGKTDLRYELDEATYQELGRKQLSINKLFPTFQDRVKNVQIRGGVRLVDTDKNILHFKVHSGTKQDVWYQCGVNFKQLNNTLKNLIWLDQSVWKPDRSNIDFRKLGLALFDNAEIRLSCSCPAQLYYGGDYILSRPKRDAKIGEPENRPPVQRNPKEYGAFCFDERALVLMADGTFKSIKDVVIGDYVFTHNGNIKKVISTSNHVDDIINVSVGGMFNEFGVTPGHKFYIRGRNQECLCGCGKKLSSSYGTINTEGIKYLYNRKFAHTEIKLNGKVGKIGLAKNMIVNGYTDEEIIKKLNEDLTNKLVWSEVESLDKYSLLYYPKLNFGEKINVDSDIARLIGYYVAEGSFTSKYTKKENDFSFVNSKGKLVCGTGILFTIANEELDTIGKDIINIINNKFGLSAKVCYVDYIRKSGGRSRYVQIIVSNKDLFKFMFDVIGFPKKLNSNIFKWNNEAKIEFITGWFLGDGSLNKQNSSCVFVSSKEVLSHQLFSLISSLCIKANIKLYKSSNNNPKFEGKRYYISIDIRNMPKEFIDKCELLNKRNWCIKDREASFEVFRLSDYMKGFGGIFRLFKKIDKSNVYKSTVYNLEVEDDQSYIVNGVVVHNCKHLQNIFKVLPFYGPTIASWLKEFHAVEIASIVKTYKVELSRIKGKKTKAVKEPVKVEPKKEEPIKAEPKEEKPKEGPKKVKEPKKVKPVEKPKKVEKPKEKPEKKQEEKPGVKISAEVEEKPEEDKKNESIKENLWDEKFKWFIERTNKHIKLVKEAAQKIVDAYPEFKNLLQRVEIHDASKFEEPERTPYISITWRHKLENEKGKYDPIKGIGYQIPGLLSKDDENKATLHHITTNMHHPEYHLEDKLDVDVNSKDRDKLNKCVNASLMPDLDIAEMVADWQAMSIELRTNTAREWFNKQKDVRWHFSEKQERLINKLLKVFEEKKESISRFDFLLRSIKESQLDMLKFGFIDKDGNLSFVPKVSNSSHLEYIHNWAWKNKINSYPENKMMDQFYEKTGYIDFIIQRDEFDIRIFVPITTKQLEVIRHQSILSKYFYWDIWGKNKEDGLENRLKSGQDFESFKSSVKDLGLLKE